MEMLSAIANENLVYIDVAPTLRMGRDARSMEMVVLVTDGFF